MTSRKWESLIARFWHFKYNVIFHVCCIIVSLFLLNYCTAENIKIFTPQPLRAIGVLFSPMESGWVGKRVVGKSFSGLYLRNRKVEEVDTWWEHRLGV